MVIQKHKSSSVHFFLWLACDGALRVGPAHLTKGHSSPFLSLKGQGKVTVFSLVVGDTRKRT